MKKLIYHLSNKRLPLLNIVLLLLSSIFTYQAYADEHDNNSNITQVSPEFNLSVDIPDQPLPLTTSVFKISDDGKMLNGGFLVPVYHDPTPSQLPYIPAEISLDNLNSNTGINSNNLLVASATASFNINFLSAGQTDSTGATCSTFPASARNVFTAAANIWGNIIQSSVPITMNACWRSFSGSVLGFAGSKTYHRNFTHAPISNTWYPVALANSIAGTDLAPSQPDIVATFNSSFSWYYGTDGNTPSTKTDLLSVILHEMGHGLGFLGSASYSSTTGRGSLGSQGSVLAYDTLVKSSSGQKITNTSIYPNPSLTLGNFLTSNNVWFAGANAVAANGGNYVKLFAPSTWQGGSSYSHLDYNTFNNTSNQLMVPSISRGEALHDPGVVTKGIFKDIGWRISGSGGGSKPGKATLLTPSGTITDTTPTYRWNAVSGSTYYYLWVGKGSSKKIGRWYTAASAGCSSGSGVCSVTPTTALGSGSHAWYIKTWNTHGLGPWSSGKSFSVSSGGTPGKATLLTPSGTITDTTPTYRWNAVSGSTYYYLWVGKGSSKKIGKWYTATSAGCSSGSGVCSVTPTTALGSGSHAWYIKTWNTHGLGPWSNGKSFSVSSGSSGFNSQFNGNATGWYRVAGSPWNYNNAYLIGNGVKGKFSSVYYKPSQYANFEYSAQVWRGSSSDGQEGYTTRLIVRGNPSILSSTKSWNSYAFQINRRGKYSIWKINNGSATPLQSWVSSSAIHKGNAWNTLKVWVRGSNLWFSINGHWVKHVVDTTFSSGYVGIGFYTNTNNASSDKLWVNWAKLTPLSSSSLVANNTIQKTISKEQLQLNTVANQSISSNANESN